MADRPTLYGADGRPVPRTPSLSPTDDPLGELVRDGVKDMGSSLQIDKAALRAVQQSRARNLAISSVPSTPRNMLRDAGGVAVGKGHSRAGVTHEYLREMRELAPILQPIHQARQYQTRVMSQKWNGQKGRVGLRIVHKDHLEHDARPPDSIKAHIERFERVFWTPAPAYNIRTLSTAGTLLMEDLLTINRPVVEKIPSAVDPRRIVQWRPVDGALIWETMSWVEKWCANNPRWNSGYESARLTDADRINIVSHRLHHDLHGAEYCLVRDGILEAVYPPGRLLVAPIQNRTDITWAGYPPSHVQQALKLIGAFISTFDYNASLFTKGMLAEFILGLPGDMHDDDVDAFVEMFREASQGVGNAWRPPIIPLPHGGDTITKIDLKNTNTEMGFEIWLSLLISLCSAVYRMDPSTINAKPWNAGKSPGLSEGNRTEEIDLAREEGLQGDIGHLCEHIYTPLAQSAHPDLIVIAEYGNYDPMKEAQVYELRGKTDMTRNEIRLENGLTPRGPWLSDDEYKTAPPEKQKAHDENLWNMPTDPGFTGAFNQGKMREQQAMMGPPGGQQAGAPAGPNDGHDDGYGGKDDGFGGTLATHDPAPYGTPAPPGAPPKPPSIPKAPGATAGMQKATPITVFVHDKDPR